MAGKIAAVSVSGTRKRLVVFRITSQLLPPCLLSTTSLSPLPLTCFQHLVGVTEIEVVF